MPSPRSTSLPGHLGDRQEFAFSPDGKTLAAGGTIGTLLLWDLRFTPPLSLRLPHDQRVVRALAFRPDGKTLATGGDAGMLFLWNVDFDS